MKAKGRNKKQKKFTEKVIIREGKASLKIPKECLQNTLKVLNDPENVVWKDRSTACERHIHQELASYLPSNLDMFNWELQLRYARECLLRRDWLHLTEILLLYKPQKGNDHLFPIFAKYASICLAYTNQPLLKSWLQSFGCKESNEVVLKKWTQLPKSTNETDSNEMEEECL